MELIMSWVNMRNVRTGDITPTNVESWENNYSNMLYEDGSPVWELVDQAEVDPPVEEELEAELDDLFDEENENGE